MKFFFFSPGHRGQPRLRDPENWQRGDVAECVYSGPWFRACSGEPVPDHLVPRMGQRIRVTAVGEGCYGVMLSLVDFAGTFHSAGFSKVRPVADEAVAAHPAFVEKLRRATPDLPPAPSRELEEAA